MISLLCQHYVEGNPLMSREIWFSMRLNGSAFPHRYVHGELADPKAIDLGRIVVKAS
jgi:hypothetical protein